MNQKKLQKVLDDHMHWIKRDITNWEKMRANLSSADLNYANLSSVNLSYANLNGAELSDDESFHYSLACPSDGCFTGWKVVNDMLIELFIPADAKRSSATTNKCRCSYASVVSITSLKTGEHYNQIINDNYNETVYTVGEKVIPDSYDNYRWNECSNGIHFFINKQDAINYIEK